MTQKAEILEYLDCYGSITPLEALRDIGCFRLAARIHDIEQMGIQIPRENYTMTKRDGGKATVTRYLRPKTRNEIDEIRTKMERVWSHENPLPPWEAWPLKGVDDE